MRRIIFSIGFVWLLFCGHVRGDILQYYYPNCEKPLTLQGKVSINPGKIVSFRHAKFGKIFFGLEDVRFYKVPTTLSIAENNLRQSQNDVEASLEAASWALHHGLLSEFNKAASQAWRLDPEHPTVRRLVTLKRKTKTYLPESRERKKALRAIVKTAKNMQCLRSKHFLLLHDCPAPEEKGRRKNHKSRAQERLDLLEIVYESFLIKYCLEGRVLDIPKKRMMAVLFSDREDYLVFSKFLGHDADNAAGYFHKLKNISVFYDQSTNEGMAMLVEVSGKLREMKEDAIRKRSPRAKDIVRLINSLNLIIEVYRENQDIEVVSHETAHQMADNTGLQPNHAVVPTWAAEGLATYFESPKEAAWAGIGVVNEKRLMWYRLLARDTKHSNIDFIVSNQIFMRAGSDITTIAAYGQAWALTHFLMDRHFDKLMEYYKLAAMRSMKEYKEIDDPKEFFKDYQADFDAIFGENKTSLTREWRDYMNSLKTDLERVTGKKER